MFSLIYGKENKNKSIFYLSRPKTPALSFRSAALRLKTTSILTKIPNERTEWFLTKTKEHYEIRKCNEIQCVNDFTLRKERRRKRKVPGRYAGRQEPKPFYKIDYYLPIPMKMNY